MVLRSFSPIGIFPVITITRRLGDKTAPLLLNCIVSRWTRPIGGCCPLAKFCRMRSFSSAALRELVDFARLYEAFAREIDWHEFAHRFASCGFATALELHLLAAERLLAVPIEPPIRTSVTARALYQRALWQVGHPRWSRLGIRLLRPWLLLRRSLSDPVLRRRLVRSLGNWTWYERQWRMFRR